MPSEPSRELVALANPHPDREYEVECVCPEFTCVCPMTGQPDFATFTITYVPGDKIVELKSLKLYLWSYRQAGAFHEDVTNRVLDDLVGCLAPRRLSVVSRWNVRGGIETTVRVSYPSDGLPWRSKAHGSEEAQAFAGHGEKEFTHHGEYGAARSDRFSGRPADDARRAAG